MIDAQTEPMKKPGEGGVRVPVFSDTIKTIGSTVTVITALVLVVWFFFGLDSRVRRLEEQVHTLTVAPTIAATSGGQSAIVPNPIAQACADLAKQMGDAINKGGHSNSESTLQDALHPNVDLPHLMQELQDLMQKLGCGSTIR